MYIPMYLDTLAFRCAEQKKKMFMFALMLVPVYRDAVKFNNRGLPWS